MIFKMYGPPLFWYMCAGTRRYYGSTCLIKVLRGQVTVLERSGATDEIYNVGKTLIYIFTASHGCYR